MLIVNLTGQFLTLKKEVAVRLSAIVRLRDSAIKYHILNLFPVEQQEEIMKKINDAFKAGDQVLKEHDLPVIYGPEKAERIQKQFDTAELG